MDRNTYKIAFESASEDALLTALRLLNGESCFGARLRIEALDRSGSRPNMARSPELDHHEPNYEASPEGELLAEEVALRDALRALVDCWMESGKVGGQGEFPRQRRLTARVQTGPPRFQKASLLSIVQRQNADRVLRAGASGEFTLVLREVRPRTSPDEIKRRDRYWRAWDCAARLFTFLVTSDHRFRIAKCRVCTQYVSLSRPRIQYKQGYTCRKCKSAQTAKAAMKKARDAAKKQLLNPAATSYVAWLSLGDKEKARYRDVQDYIAEKLREAEFDVTRKWVSGKLPKIKRRGRLLIDRNSRDDKR